MPDRVPVLRRLTRPLLLAASLGLAGCAVLGPDYREPQVDWLAAWQPDLYGLADPTAPGEQDLRFWWHLFQDERLNRLMELAREHNPSLRLAGLSILESRALMGIAGSARYPQLKQASGAANYVDSRQRSGARDAVSQDLVAYQLGFAAAWELDFWGRFRRGIEAADAAFFASLANHQDAQVLLAAQVASLYLGYRSGQIRVAIARQNAALQQRSYQISERIFRNGGDSELDLQQAKSQYLATLSTIPQLQLNLVKTRNALCALLGRPPGEIAELADQPTSLPRVVPDAVREAPARLLLRRPDVRAAAWQIAAQSAQIGIAEADYYPAISLLGNLDWSGNSLGGTPHTAALAIGPAVRWNLFDHGRISNNVRLQDARLQQLIESYQARVLGAAREIDDAAAGLARLAEQQDLIDQSVVAARRALDIANTRYREGYADFQRVLDGQRALFAQMDRQVINQGSHLDSLVQLYKALGGGWLALEQTGLVPEATRQQMRERTDWGPLLDAPLPADQNLPPAARRDARHDG
jgi:NodT family efflux transporter outer membrane factor (OMF) lipoprotein